MSEPEQTPQTLNATVTVEISPESRSLVALSPVELRIRTVYNHLTTFGVACLGMFVPLLAMLVVPSPCIPHFQAYLIAAIITGLVAAISLGYAFYGNRQEEKMRTR